MADFLVRHGLNPDKVVRFSITLTQVLDVPQHRPPEELLTEYPRLEGDEVWILEIGTYELDTNGDEIPTRKINLTSLSDVDREIQETVEDMCQLIEWDPLKTDAQPPYVYWYLPNNGEIEIGWSPDRDAKEATVTDVLITTQVYFKIRDSLPAAGIDYSSVNVVFTTWHSENNLPIEFDITSEVELSGSPYDLQIYWNPPLRAWTDDYGG